MKKRLNKKGFMFIETIITLTVMMVVLLMLYTFFTNLLEKERTITAYDKKGYVYSLHYVRYYLQEKGFDLKLKNNVYFTRNAEDYSPTGRSTDRASLMQYVLYAKDDDFINDVDGDKKKAARKAYYDQLMQDLKKRFGLVRLEFVKGNINGLDDSMRNETGFEDMYSSSLYDYSKNMVPSDDTIPDGVIKLIAEFKDDITGKYYYSWVYAPNIKR